METTTEAIWDEFHTKIKSFILRRVSDRDATEDILQDVFLKIHSNIDTLKDRNKLQSWVYQITRNTIVDHYRKNNFKYDKIEDVEIAEEIVSDDNQLHKEIAQGLKILVDILPEKYSKAIDLVELKGMSQVELAKELNISLSGAKSRVQRGRQMIKDMLMQCCHYEFDKYGTILDAKPNTCCCCN